VGAGMKATGNLAVFAAIAAILMVSTGVVTATLIGRKISAGRRSRGCGRSLPCVSSFGPEQAKSWA
jgi:hypothetical protein